MSEQSFKQAYEVLSRHAQTLREQTEPGIDDLLKIVTESVQAFKVCSHRIDAVEKALEQYGDDDLTPLELQAMYD